MSGDELIARALSLVASGEPAKAIRALEAPSGEEGQGLLRAALHEHLLAHATP